MILAARTHDATRATAKVVGAVAVQLHLEQSRATRTARLRLVLLDTISSPAHAPCCLTPAISARLIVTASHPRAKVVAAAPSPQKAATHASNVEAREACAPRVILITTWTLASASRW